MLLYACVYTYINVCWLALASFSTLSLPMARIVTHDCKNKMQNYQIQVKYRPDITAPQQSTFYFGAQDNIRARRDYIEAEHSQIIMQPKHQKANKFFIAS